MKFHRSVLLSNAWCWEQGPAPPQAPLPSVGGTPGKPHPRPSPQCASQLAFAPRSETLREPLGPAEALRLTLTSAVTVQEANR